MSQSTANKQADWLRVKQLRSDPQMVLSGDSIKHTAGAFNGKGSECDWLYRDCSRLIEWDNTIHEPPPTPLA
jgi:hypothetical protein